MDSFDQRLIGFGEAVLELGFTPNFHDAHVVAAVLHNDERRIEFELRGFSGRQDSAGRITEEQFTCTLVWAHVRSASINLDGEDIYDLEFEPTIDRLAP